MASRKSTSPRKNSSKPSHPKRQIWQTNKSKKSVKLTGPFGLMYQAISETSQTIERQIHTPQNIPQKSAHSTLIRNILIFIVMMVVTVFIITPTAQSIDWLIALLQVPYAKEHLPILYEQIVNILIEIVKAILTALLLPTLR